MRPMSDGQIIIRLEEANEFPYRKRSHLQIFIIKRFFNERNYLPKK